MQVCDKCKRFNGSVEHHRLRLETLNPYHEGCRVLWIDRPDVDLCRDCFMELLSIVTTMLRGFQWSANPYPFE